MLSVKESWRLARIWVDGSDAGRSYWDMEGISLSISRTPEFVASTRGHFWQVMLSEVRDQFQNMSEFGCEDSRGFFISAFGSCPADKVKEFSDATVIVNLGVKNLGDFNFRFIINCFLFYFILLFIFKHALLSIGVILHHRHYIQLCR